jgi:hypothetical protein
MTPILLTRDAALDEYTLEQYWEIYQEVRGWHQEYSEKTKLWEWKYLLTLDEFLSVVGEPPSKASWSRYHQTEGREGLSRVMRNRLRAAMNLPPLPDTVAEVMDRWVRPNSSVWLAGDGEADRVVLVGASVRACTVAVDGDQCVMTLSAPTNAVHPRTRSQRESYRPFLRKEIKFVVESSGHTAEELILKGREAYDREERNGDA